MKAIGCNGAITLDAKRPSYFENSGPAFGIRGPFWVSVRNPK
jgi:hypothetical protein